MNEKNLKSEIENSKGKIINGFKEFIDQYDNTKLKYIQYRKVIDEIIWYVFLLIAERRDSKVLKKSDIEYIKTQITKIIGFAYLTIFYLPQSPQTLSLLFQQSAVIHQTRRLAPKGCRYA